MSADLHIHIMRGVTEDDIAEFFSHTLGSKHFDFGKPNHSMELYDKFASTPDIWVGEVSWLKAVLFDDDEQFVPEPVAKIAEIIGEDLPVIDDALIARIMEAMLLPNSTGYALANAGAIKEFLQDCKGERCFTISW